MLKITIGDETTLMTEETYKAAVFGKINHINHGWEPGPYEVAPVFEPAPATIFDSVIKPEPPAIPPTHEEEEV